MDPEKPKVIIVVGPTASGKSDLAITLAQKYGGEIISADSRQIYRKLDIGTAKTTSEEMKGVPHHLIDILDTSASYSAADFKKDARETIDSIIDRGNRPIIAGGTFFYIDALLERVGTADVPPNQELREKLEAMPNDSLYEALLKLDERRALEIDKDNKRRLVRALEIIEARGKVPEQSESISPYQTLFLGIKVEKNELRKRFTKRAKKWLQNGFLEEVQELLSSGVSDERLSEIGFEYKLGIDLLHKKITEATFLQMFEEKNWQYAKRQLTWLKKDTSINWVTHSDKREIDLLIKQFLMS